MSIVSCGVDDEMDIVELVRTKSVAGAMLGRIYVPSFLKAHLQQPARSIGDHSLADVLKHERNLPISVYLTKISTGGSLSTDDSVLLNESPLEIVAEREYGVVYVTLLHDKKSVKSKTSSPWSQNEKKQHQEAREIPEFLGIKARRIHARVAGSKACLNYRKPEARLYRLTLTQFSILYEAKEEEDEDSDGNYEDIPVKPRRRSEADEPPLPPRSPDQIAEIITRTPVRAPDWLAKRVPGEVTTKSLPRPARKPRLPRRQTSDLKGKILLPLHKPPAKLPKPEAAKLPIPDSRQDQADVHVKPAPGAR